jgi:hypothetical protein
MKKEIYPLPRVASPAEAAMPRLAAARRLGLGGLLLAALLAAGCFDGIAWFPDSSALVFTEKDGRRLVRYDIKTSQRQTLVEDTRAATLWPAISPDGKRIAVATWQHEKHRPSLLQVVIFLSTGAEEWRSTAFEWLPSKEETDLGPTFVFWMAKDRLLLFAGEMALYERDRDRLVRLGAVQPLLVSPFPVRPDGKGFLAVRDTKDGKSELVFVNWQGKAQPIEGQLPDFEKDNFPLGYRLRWEKDTAILSGPTMAIRADTRTGKLTRSEDRPAVLPAEGNLFVAHPFPRAGTILCCYQVTKPRKIGGLGVWRIELHDPAAKKRQVLFNRCEVLPVAFPSPDGKMVALRYSVEKEKMKILILDSAGKKVGDFEIEK